MKKTLEAVCGSTTWWGVRNPGSDSALYRIRLKNSLSALHRSTNTCPNPDRKAQGLKMVFYISPPSLRCIHQILPDGEGDTNIFYSPRSPFPFKSVWGHKTSSSCLPQKPLTLSFCLLVVSNEPFSNFFLSVPPQQTEGDRHPFWSCQVYILVPYSKIKAGLPSGSLCCLPWIPQSFALVKASCSPYSKDWTCRM